MKISKTKILWGIFIFYTIIHLLLLPIALLYAKDIINLERVGITKYFLNYIGRSILFLLFFSVSFFIFKKKKYHIDFDKVLILFLVSTCIFIDTLGNFAGWYDVNNIVGVFWFDDLVHFIVPLLLTFALFWYLVFLRRNTKKNSIILAGSIIFSFSALWEVFEYWSDRVAGTELLKGGIEDTFNDLTADFFGVLLCCLILWAIFGGKRDTLKQDI